MSSSSVFQGLQSCLKSKIIEPRVLQLKLDPPKSNFSRSVAPPSPAFTHPDDLKTESHTSTENKNSCDDDDDGDGECDCDVKSQRNADVRGWSFLQFLSNPSENVKETTEKEKVYVHPLVKRSASMLSEKSLEMCTESLGSETGSSQVVSESSDETEFCEARDPPRQPRESSVARKMKRIGSFPPPLTSISGSNGVQVRPHREGGRLVLEAVTVTTSHTYFHAERSEGRLRLCILKDCPPNMDNEDDPEDDVDEEEEEEEEDDDDEEEEEDDEAKEDEDIEENNEKVRGEMGVKKVPRPSRCKEGGGGCAANGLHNNWDSFWVATST